MNRKECKPGDHLWCMYAHDKIFEVEVLQDPEPIYQDFVYIKLLECPPGWRSPRYIRAGNLCKTKKDVLWDWIKFYDVRISERELKIERLEAERQELLKKKQELIELYNKE